jgi:hypothetical protein
LAPGLHAEATSLYLDNDAHALLANVVNQLHFLAVGGLLELDELPLAELLLAEL